MQELRPLPRAIRPLNDPDYERIIREYGRNIIPLPSQCSTCGGAGTFRWYVRPTAEIDEWKCNCEDQWILAHWLLHCGIGLKYQRFDWYDLVVPKPEKVQEYLEHARLIIPTGRGLVLYGPPGTGKTLLATLILKALIGQGHDGYFTTYADMLTRLTLTKFNAEEQEWFKRRVKLAGVLVIDDIGREQQQRVHVRNAETTGTIDLTTTLAERAFEDVIRARTANQLPTLITSNLDLNDIQTKYGVNVISLLREQSTSVRLEGADWRESSRDRGMEEIKLGLRRPVVL